MSYPPQPPPGQPYGGPPDLHPQDPPKRQRIWPLIVLPVLFVAAGTAAYIAYDRGIILKDSGVEACEALRNGQAAVGGDNDTTLTEAEYRELRGVFADSRHDDIADHGTKLIDVLWQVTQLGEEPGMAALAYIGPLTTHMSGLQSACADQGVIVTLRPAADASAAPEPGEVGIPACAEVFAAGKEIAEDFGGECINDDGQSWSVLPMDCTDGRKLYQVEQASGAEPGWGYAGSTYKAQDTTKQNSKYSAALEDCTT